MPELIRERPNAMLDLDATSNIPIVRPDLAGAVLLTPGAAWVYGAWVEVVAAGVLSGHALWVIFGGGIADQFQFQIGQGAAGAEVVIGTFGMDMTNVSQYYIPIYPMIPITANARVAARVAANAGVGSLQRLKCGFIPQPW